MKNNLTDFQILKYNSSKLYFVFYIILFIIQFIFAYITGTNVIAPTVVLITIGLIALSVVFARKKGKNACVRVFLVGFLSVSAMLFAKFSYVPLYGWTFATQSYNTSILILIYTVLTCFFYVKWIYLFVTFYSITAWTIFFILAYLNGAELYFRTTIDGVPIISGTNILREVFLILGCLFVMMVVFMIMRVVIKFIAESATQKEILQKNAENEKRIANEVKERVKILFKEIDNEYNLVDEFSTKTQSQAASFEQMSAAVEELLASAEGIANGALEQLSGNEKLEEIMLKFKETQNLTKENLSLTLSNISDITHDSTEAGVQLRAVERTVAKITEQSERINETVKIITDIADRINLLSLNAAIEAARAGESGKGFAVVADEIGKLAFQTQESIQEIENVLTVNNKETINGVKVIQKTAEMIRQMLEKVESGSDKINQLKQSIIEEEGYISFLVDQMRNNIKLAQNFEIGTDEQKNAIEGITSAITNMNEMLTQMVEEVQDLSRSAGEIRGSATCILDQFKECKD